MDESLDEEDMAALTSVLTRSLELEYLSLWLPHLGLEMAPLVVSPDRCTSIALAQRVRIFLEDSISMKFVGMTPRWKALSIDAQFVFLEVIDIASLLHGLEHFLIEGLRLRGHAGLALAHGSTQLGRKHDVNDKDYGAFAQLGSDLG